VVGWLSRPKLVSHPSARLGDLGESAALFSGAPNLPQVSAAEREHLWASLESLPQAEAAWRGVPSEDYLAILSAVEASLCTTPPSAREPNLGPDLLDRLERRKVTEEARALARYVLVTWQLPERVALSLRAFLRGHPGYSPGQSGWAMAGLASLTEPEEARHLEELVRQNGALHRWRDPPPPGQPAIRFAELCERPTAVARLAARMPGAFSAGLMRYLAASPVEQSVADGGLRFAVLGAERDEAAATLAVRLRVQNASASERPLSLEGLRLSGLSTAPLVDPPTPRLGAGASREVRLNFSSIPDSVAEAAILVVRPGMELQAYSEVLR
jgi:hypothetical protein